MAYVKDSSLKLYLDSKDYPVGSKSTTWADKSGNGNDATISNFKFDGTDGWTEDGLLFYLATKLDVNVANGNVGTGDFTFCMKFNMPEAWDSSLFRTAIDNILVVGVSGRLVYPAKDMFTDIINPDNEYYISIRRTNGITQIYLNNVKQGANTTDTSLVDFTSSGISGNYLHACVQSVAIYSRALTNSEMIYNYNDAMELPQPKYVTNGLQMYLNAKDYAGDSTDTTWLDKSGSENNAIMSGFNGTIQSGLNGDRVVFDGTDDYVTTASTLSQYDNFTFTFDIMMLSIPSTTGSIVEIIDGYGAGGNYHDISVETVTPSTFRLRMNEMGGLPNPLYSTRNDLTINTRYHVTWTHAKFMNYIYINGVLDNSIPATDWGWQYFQNCHIGAFGNTQYTNMALYGISLYNRILTQSEVTQNYNVAIGNTVINFEDGQFPEDAIFSSTYAPTIVPDPTNSGRGNVVRSNCNGVNSGVSSVMLYANCDGEISFDFFTQGEAGFDTFKVYANNTLHLQASGAPTDTSFNIQKNIDNCTLTNPSKWNTYTLKNLVNGWNQIKFEFSKDGGVDSGIDGFYLDNIIFTPYEKPIETGLKVIDFEDMNFPQGTTFSSQYAPTIIEDPTGFRHGKVVKTSNGGKGSSTSSFTVPITLVQVGDISFDFFYQGETDYDWMRVIVDSTVYLRVSGSPDTTVDIAVNLNASPINLSAWNTYTLASLSAGTHNITFEYMKDNAADHGIDALLIDNITYSSSEQTSTPATITLTSVPTITAVAIAPIVVVQKFATVIEIAPTITSEAKIPKVSVGVNTYPNAPPYVQDGLALYLNPMVGVSGTEWKDLSGNGNNAAMSGFASPATAYSGLNGDRIIFDGTNDSCTILDAPSLNNLNGLTIEVVAKINNNANLNSLVCKSTDTTYGFWSAIDLRNGSKKFRTQAKISPTTDYSVLTDITQDIIGKKISYVYTFGNGYLKQYINNQIVSTTPITSSSILNESTNLTIGSRNGTQFLFNGEIYLVRVYNKALTDAEVTQNYKSTLPIVTDGLQLYLDGSQNPEGSTATTWNDLSGNSNNAVLNGNPIWDGKSLVFDGANDYAKTVTNTNFQIANNITYEAVVYQTARNSESTIMANGTGNFKFCVGSDGTLFIDHYRKDNAWQYLRFTYRIDLNKLYHLEVVIKPDSILLYVNGVYQETIAFADSMNPADYMSIGANGYGGERFNGKIYICRFYNRVLTASEVKQNYRASQGIALNGLQLYLDAKNGSGTTTWNDMSASNLYKYHNELQYNLTTYAGWSLDTGIVADSSGINLTVTSAGNYKLDIEMHNTQFKANTKYGILLNVVTNNTGSTIGMTSYLTGAMETVAGVNVTGNVKKLITTRTSITTNEFDLVSNYMSIGTTIKVKDIRAFELPIGSRIESDFNNLTADELNAIYLMQPKGQDGIHEYWNNATLSGINGTALSGFNNGKLVFDGTDDRAIINTCYGTFPLTIETVMKVTKSQFSCLLHMHQNDTTANAGIMLIAGETGITLWGIAGDISVPSTHNINTPVHIVLIYTTSNVKIYINGKLMRNLVGTFNSLGAGVVSVGSRYDGYSLFTGDVNYVREYNYALSEPEITQNFLASVNEPVTITTTAPTTTVSSIAPTVVIETASTPVTIAVTKPDITVSSNAPTLKNTCYVYDNFDRANNTSSLGSTSTGQNWIIANGGPWGIQSNKAYVPSGIDVACLVGINTGVNDNIRISVDVTYRINNVCGIMFRGDGTNNNRLAFLVSEATNTVQLSKRVAGVASTIATAPFNRVDGETHNMKVELKGNVIRCYVDNVLKIAVKDTDLQGNGFHGLVAYYFTGAPTVTFDNFKIESFETEYVEEGLQLYLDAKDGSGTQTIWEDKSGNGNNATLNNFPPNPWTGTALTFDGIDDYASIGTVGDNFNLLTLEYYGKLFDNGVAQGLAGGWGRVIQKGNSTGYGFSIRTQGNILYFQVKRYDDTQCLTYTFIPDTFYHIIGVFDGTTIKLYINGILQANIWYADNAGDSGTNEFIIGRRANIDIADQYAKATIGLLRMYNRALDDSEITKNYNVAMAAPSSTNITVTQTKPNITVTPKTNTVSVVKNITQIVVKPSITVTPKNNTVSAIKNITQIVVVKPNITVTPKANTVSAVKNITQIVVKPNITVSSIASKVFTKPYVEDGLQLYLDAKDYQTGSTSTVWSDKSGNGNDGILNLFNNGVSSGWNNGTLITDGVDDYVKINSNLGLTNSAFTYEIALIVKSIPYDWGRIISIISADNKAVASLAFDKFTSDYTGQPGFKIHVDNQAPTAGQLYNSIIWNSPINLNTKYIIQVVWDYINGGRCYINGVEVANDSFKNFKGLLPNSAQRVCIGNNDYSSSPSNLAINSVKIYNRALTSSEVNQNYRAIMAAPSSTNITVVQTKPYITVTPKNNTVSAIKNITQIVVKPNITVTANNAYTGTSKSITVTQTKPSITVTPKTNTVSTVKNITQIVTKPDITVTPKTNAVSVGKTQTVTKPNITVTANNPSVGGGKLVTQVVTKSDITVTPKVNTVSTVRNITQIVTKQNITVTPKANSVSAGNTQVVIKPSITVTPKNPSVGVGKLVTQVVTKQNITVTPKNNTVSVGKTQAITKPNITVNPRIPALSISMSMATTKSNITVTAYGGEAVSSGTIVIPQIKQNIIVESKTPVINLVRKPTVIVTKENVIVSSNAPSVIPQHNITITVGTVGVVTSSEDVTVTVKKNIAVAQAKSNIEVQSKAASSYIVRNINVIETKSNISAESYAPSSVRTRNVNITITKPNITVKPNNPIAGIGISNLVVVTKAEITLH
jgi:hypothetical protein